MIHLIHRSPVLPPVVLLVVLLGIVLATRGAGSHQSSRDRTAVRCAAASESDSPVRERTPGTVASPASVATPRPGEYIPAGVGTPMVEAGLSVTLRVDELKAGPVDLTIEVVDAAGRPVSGATVTIETQHLEMNHGVSTDEAGAVAPGCYVAERVGMGMGGTWQADVTVDLSGKPPVEVTFVVELVGPH